MRFCALVAPASAWITTGATPLGAWPTIDAMSLAVHTRPHRVSSRDQRRSPTSTQELARPRTSGDELIAQACCSRGTSTCANGTACTREPVCQCAHAWRMARHAGTPTGGDRDAAGGDCTIASSPHRAISHSHCALTLTPRHRERQRTTCTTLGAHSSITKAVQRNAEAPSQA